MRKISQFIHWKGSYLLVRLVLAGVFIWAGALKLMEVDSFAGTISEFNLAPEGWLAPMAYGLPVLEILAGVGLALEAPGALLAIALMLTGFIAVLWFGILSGLHIDCGCFSAEDLAGHDSLRQAFYRDIGLVAAAAYLYFWRGRRRKSIWARL